MKLLPNRIKTNTSKFYNDVEQVRLEDSIINAKSKITSNGNVALDYGCGAGNLTNHLLNSGFQVIAADVTPSFVKMVTDRFGEQVQGLILNGKDMNNVQSNTFDFIATYSVLHHIPDYLSAISDMVRVLKPGGVLLLEHEACPSNWAPSTELLQFKQLGAEKLSPGEIFRRLTSYKWWKRRIRKTLYPRYAEEGDIHIWPDDHIEWDKIEQVLLLNGMEIVEVKDYLLYQPQYSLETYNSFKDRCTDMRYMIARKL